MNDLDEGKCRTCGKIKPVKTRMFYSKGTHSNLTSKDFFCDDCWPSVKEKLEAL